MKLRKIIFYVLLGIGLAFMLFEGTLVILKAFAGIHVNNWFFFQPRIRLIIFTVYTVVVLMLKTQIVERR